MKTDILIAGSGCSGLYCALQLPRDKKITVITKSDLTSNDSFLAQGGMCMLKEQSDYDSFFEDTMKAGHYENDKKSVEIMIKTSPEVVRDLVSYGAQFERNEDGSLAYTKEGAHSTNRIIFHEDSDVQNTWNEIKLAGIKEYFQKQYPQLEIYYDVVKNDNLLSSLDSYIKSNHIDIITLTSYKRNIFSRLFNPGIARKMIFHSDTPLLVIYGRPN